MILDKIQSKLLELDQNVFYGAADNSLRETLWNYIVFNRKPTKISVNQTSYTYYFSVNIIRENYIPEGLDLEVIKKMKEVPGMKLAGTDMEYNYIKKPNTNTVVEMLSIDFIKTEKRQ